MIVPLLIFLASGIGLGLALFLPGHSDFILLAGPMALASLYLLLRAGRKPNRLGPTKWPKAEPSEKRLRAPWAPAKPKWIVVDGSNVMHWRDGTPKIEAVQDVVNRLTDLGYSPGVVFDANAGHKLTGRYKHDHALGKLLGLPEARVMVVDKGTPADPTILAAARDLGARVVTNDRYRDWAETHPEVASAGHLIRGGYRDGHLWLDMVAAQPKLRAS